MTFKNSSFATTNMFTSICYCYLMWSDNILIKGNTEQEFADHKGLLKTFFQNNFSCLHIFVHESFFYQSFAGFAEASRGLRCLIWGVNE